MYSFAQYVPARGASHLWLIISSLRSEAWRQLCPRWRPVLGGRARAAARAPASQAGQGASQPASQAGEVGAPLKRGASASQPASQSAPASQPASQPRSLRARVAPAPGALGVTITLGLEPHVRMWLAGTDFA